MVLSIDEKMCLRLLTVMVIGQFILTLILLTDSGLGSKGIDWNENGGIKSETGFVNVMRMICHTIEKCVMGYFETFQYCWYWTLYWMWRMISDYLVLLGIVVSCLSASPTCYVFVAGACLMLFLTYTFILDLKNDDEF